MRYIASYYILTSDTWEFKFATLKQVSMERTSFSLLFYIRRTKLNKAGEAPIFMRITVNGQRADASARRFIEPRLWNTAKGKAVENGRGCKELNFYLDAVSANILRVQRDMELEGTELSAHAVLDRYLGKDRSERHTLIGLFIEHNEKQKKLVGIDVAPATAVRYETCRKLVGQFLWQAYRRKDMYLDEMSRQFVEDYEYFLKTERCCSHNTAIQYLKNLKKITRIAQMKGWLSRDPFAEIRFHKEQIDRDFLEKHELKKLLDKTIDIPRLAQIRDIFAFCCLTGLAFSDVKQLRREHIATDINGMQWIRKTRQKTGNMCNIPLLDAAQEILARYHNNPYCQAHDVLLPVCSNQKMNSYLKELADICGIKKHLSTHTARHTFATLTLASGATIETVAKMLGHSDTKMTRHYARILDSSIMRDMQTVAKNMAL